MSTHDNAYKNVFSHPKAVQDLLRGFVHEDWVQQLDYTTLEKSAEAMSATTCATEKTTSSAIPHARPNAKRSASAG